MNNRSESISTDSSLLAESQVEAVHGHTPSHHSCGDAAQTGKKGECSGHGHSHGGGHQWELPCAVAAAVALVVGWILSFLTAVPAEIPWGLYIVSYVLTGWFLVQDVAYRLRQGQFDIDSLMLLAAAGAAYLDKWAEGALLLVLFSIGHALESYAMGRAKRAIEALTKLAPAIAHVRRGEELIDLPVEELTVGDVVVIKPGERVSADGFVISGSGSVDQAPVTGESVPVDKHPVENIAEAARNPERLSQEHRVFAGTLNGAHALEIHVTKSAADNTLARVIKMVSEAENRVSPTQTFTRRIERYFVPTVLAFDVLLLFAWLIIDEPVSASLYRAMSVLVAASPCALAIATPSAVLSGVARAARGGVLIKGGGPLESLGTIHAIAFDKTGTLTEGKPRITDVVPLFGNSQEQLLRVAVAVESLTDHPLASAVVRDARAMLRGSDLPRADDLQILIGRGVKASVDGLTAMIGNAKLFQTEVGSLPEELAGKMEQLQSAGRTTMIVRHGDQYLGVLGIMDTPRASAPSVTRELKQLGIRRLLMLSGDHQQVADAVAKSVGITEASGDLLPEDKVRIIRTLGDEEGVAMVGDGVNDAPAMANATIGIAMGAAGSDVALETADIALMGDDLTKLPFAVGLSRKTRTIIRQNVFISMGMVFFLVPAAALGLPLGPAVVLHEGSTIVVALNALRLLFYKAAELPASSSEAPH